MSHFNFDYVPLTFINDQEEIKKQIRNTLILIHLFEKYNNPVRLEKLIEGTQYGYNASALQSGKNKFLRISDIHESKVNWDTVPYCNCDDEKTYLLKKDDILIARTGGTTGKSFKIDNPPAHSIYAGYLIRIRAKQEVNPDYIYLFLHSFAYWSQIVNLNERNFRPKANAENLKSLILPDCLPDIQNDAVKISNGELVKGYEELYSAIEKALGEYDKTQEVQNLLTNQLSQLENLNQAILQEAVQGKLVPQDKNDEPANELHKRIKAEKAKAGKKEKPLPSIKPEEIPFEIPESWVWSRLGEIAQNVEYGTSQKAEMTADHIPVLRMNNIQSGKIDYSNLKYVSDEIEDLPKLYLEDGDMLFNRTNSYELVGKTAVYRGLNETMTFASYLIRVQFNKKIVSEFIANYINSPICRETQLEPEIIQQNGQANFNGTKLKNILIPLPPLSEQQRIVAAIENQFAKTQQLKAHIIANQQATEQLLNALLHQAFEVALSKPNLHHKR